MVLSFKLSNIFKKMSNYGGLGFLEYDPSPMSIEEARKLLKENSYFDYINGRVMKISLIGNLITTHGYNCENGDGVAERIISHCHNIK